VLLLQSVDAAFARADPDDLLYRRHKNLAVADLAGIRSLDDGVDGGLDHGRWQHDIYPQLRQEINHIFCATVKLRMTLLAPETLDFSDGDTRRADVSKGFAHFVKLEGLDDGGDHFHSWFLVKFCNLAISLPAGDW